MKFSVYVLGRNINSKVATKSVGCEKYKVEKKVKIMKLRSQLNLKREGTFLCCNAIFPVVT